MSCLAMGECSRLATVGCCSGGSQFNSSATNRLTKPSSLFSVHQSCAPSHPPPPCSGGAYGPSGRRSILEKGSQIDYSRGERSANGTSDIHSAVHSRFDVRSPYVSQPPLRCLASYLIHLIRPH